MDAALELGEDGIVEGLSDFSLEGLTCGEGVLWEVFGSGARQPAAEGVVGGSGGGVANERVHSFTPVPCSMRCVPWPVSRAAVSVP